MTQTALRVIPKETEVSLKRNLINSLDLDRVIARVASENNWDNKKAKQIEAQYRAFLTVAYANPGIRLIPSVDIDEVWHSHILHTIDYCRMSQDIFGGYLHHTPQLENEIDVEAHQNDFHQSKELIIAELNEMGQNNQVDEFRSAAICDGGAYCDDIQPAICDGGAYCD